MTNDVAERTKETVLDVAREISREDVSEDLDPITAGFDSISTMELATRLEEELGVDCTIEDVFETGSLAELAQTLAERIDRASGR